MFGAYIRKHQVLTHFDTLAHTLLVGFDPNLVGFIMAHDRTITHMESRIGRHQGSDMGATGFLEDLSNIEANKYYIPNHLKLYSLAHPLTETPCHPVSTAGNPRVNTNKCEEKAYNKLLHASNGVYISINWEKNNYFYIYQRCSKL